MMKLKTTLRTIAFAAVSLVITTGDMAAEKPNILFILADDLGYGDLGCYGHPVVKTPHLDQLATQGVRFTDCHSASNNCSPSRAAILTGRHPYRVGIYDFLSGSKPFYLHPEEKSVASMLKAAGYQTMFSGKWHLGGFTDAKGKLARPDAFGFDHWLACEHNFSRDPDSLVRNGKPAGNLTGSQATVTVEECIDWLDSEDRDPNKPFCMFLWLNESHSPITPSREWSDIYNNDAARTAALEVPLGGPGVVRKSNPKLVHRYYGCVAEMDHEVGRLLKVLDDKNLSKNTFVMFTSDNGPEHRQGGSWGSPGVFRGAKGHMHEGGHRVPGIVRWPQKVKPGTVSDVTINGTDILPTLCEVGGAEMTTTVTVDGGSFVPLLLGAKEVSRPQPLFWWMYHSRGGKQAALREGDWKIIAAQTLGGDDKSTKNRAGMHVVKESKLIEFELYNLKNDAGESRDVSAENPERFEAMKKRINAQFLNVQAEARDWPTWGTKLKNNKKSAKQK
ncbi:sulfatase-like hydrolase/transferase [Verrucomicrobiaceae bacterium N1E253]|uniref:Sulfatase-like hydrolase/transferase n=1 Tax=Oceaniferula marina TaxID=2748318 RepID=A0A851GIS0_9BACT|nr:sulfatase-like hydrolase/transferase [Oceaniferula marina]NWK54540.1 sulfatase-like hydrolase/transferase [Oceaniferula marina]